MLWIPGSSSFYRIIRSLAFTERHIDSGIFSTGQVTFAWSRYSRKTPVTVEHRRSLYNILLIIKRRENELDHRFSCALPINYTADARANGRVILGRHTKSGETQSAIGDYKIAARSGQNKQDRWTNLLAMPPSPSSLHRFRDPDVGQGTVPAKEGREMGKPYETRPRNR